MWGDMGSACARPSASRPSAGTRALTLTLTLTLTRHEGLHEKLAVLHAEKRAAEEVGIGGYSSGT